MVKTAKILFSILILAGLALFFQNCGRPPGVGDSNSYSSLPSYSELNEKIFAPKCLSCHSSGSPNFSSYDSLVAGTSIVPGDPNGSLLYQQIVNGLMPKNNPLLSESDIQAVSAWILAGALSGGEPVTLPPDAPTSFVANALSPTEITLTWVLPSSTVTGVKIERSNGSSGPFSTVASLALSTSTYIDTGLSASTTYYYRVSLSNSIGSSPYSNIASGTTFGYPPSAPTSLVSTAFSENQINLNWTDNSSDETGFKIQRASSLNGAYTTIATLGSNSVSYSNTGLSASTTYYYRVFAYNGEGNSNYSNTSNSTTLATPLNPPTAPGNFLATGVSANQINLSWADNSGNETGFKIERGLSSSGPFSQVASVSSNVTSYSDTNLNASTTYYYRMYAYNAAGNSNSTNVANGTTQSNAVTLPNAPTGLNVAAVSSTQINLSWTDNSGDESGFKIERALSSSGPFSLLATTGANIISYSNTGLTASTTYYYRIYSYNSAGNSTATSVSSAMTSGTAPNAPSGLSAAGVSATQINLSWNDNSNNETGFKVERSTSSTGTYSLIATLGAGVVSYSNTGLNISSTYYYRVYAYNANGNSANSSLVSASTFGSFSWINTNIIQPKCITCHSGVAPKGGYDMSSFNNVMTRVNASNSSSSLLYQRVLDGTMPKSGSSLSTNELNSIKTWIDSGATNN